MTPDRLAQAFLAACRAELDALKPGNVHRFRPGHSMEITHFEAAAVAAAPHIAASGAGVGERIEGAVEASVAAAGLNTNLGIVLLCAPLAVAAERGGALRERLGEVLAGLTVADADAAFRAISRANPGGIGAPSAHDVREPARITLRDAMGEAAHRDRIAAQYVNGFEDVLTLGLPQLDGLSARAGTEAVYMAFLATFPDSHIARKFGVETAERVRTEAAGIAAGIDWSASEGQRHRVLDAFDLSLKDRGLNPGTSADLTVATLFAATLLR
ncbi:triphosphoribosyl-dephospho-CoA synthase [Ancylobacter sp. A5.8]|uniref:triphosphoribosyl-dephospho-CoA synthase n=1 Tax=Ancylobacter gelatini TaxID=2919920 RepID=UPI001F4D9481|nr:triphosphoribosyl-dephospho-CoA synthase [Ancylobacter gelatini]MCJ8144286.1 triphosphoribosyl-dephospho-CoA synthase [Ancylobacter gelatini]